MSQRRIKAVEITNYGAAIAAASGIGGLSHILGNHSATASTPFGESVYLSSRDRIYTLGRNSVGVPGAMLYKLDPDFFLTAPSDGVLAAQGTGTMVGFSSGRLSTGQYNPQTGQQGLFYARDIGAVIVAVNPDTLVCQSAAAFTGPNGDVTPDSSDIVNGEGFWQNLAPGRFIAFTGLTAGIPDETLLSGAGVYPSGLMLVHATGRTLGGVSRNNVWVWVDLRTRRAVGRLGGLTVTGFPARAMANPSANQDQTEVPIAGDTIDWTPGGFVPDADSLNFEQPKGVLFVHSIFSLPAGSSAITDPVPGDVFRIYTRLFDFNPFNLASAQGIPTRTHGRIRHTSRMVVSRSPIYDQAGAAEWVGFTNYMAPCYDPLRQRFVQFAHRNITPQRVQVGDNWAGLFSLAPDPVIVTNPAARSIPRTNDVVDFDCFVGGDLAEPGVGLSVAWTLTRRSSEGEPLTITGGVGTTSTVAHPAIDTDSAGVPDLVVVADGVQLALTTDYTVVASTGVLTWVTSQAGKTVLASYKHRATDATPAHGTLLIGQSQTDENGVARTQVQYADDDDLVGKIDALTTTLV